MSDTISQLVDEGYAQDQAVAIAEDHCKSMSATVYKHGHQSEQDPFEFVMSAESVDRVGDVVRQDWNLRNFRKNPIALFGHDSSLPIGTWRDVRVEGKRLMGRLELAKKGTSDFIDSVRSLVEQGILKAVSVGFRPGDYKVLDKNDPYSGLELYNNELLECSLVSVPAHPDALSIAKAFGVTDAVRMFTETGDSDSCASECAAKQLGINRSRASDSKSKPTRKNPMSLSEKIDVAKKSLATKRDQLTELTEKDLSVMPEDEVEVTDAQIEELTKQIGDEEAQIERLLKAESALAAKAFDSAPAKSEPVPRVMTRKMRKKGHNVFGAVSCMIKEHMGNGRALEIAAKHYQDDPEIQTVIKAATDPATTGDAAWAGNLVRESWGEYLELLRDIAVYPRLPGMRLEFDRFGKINIPRNDGRGSLSGGFFAEGSGIPVKEGVFGTTDLEPFDFGVITSMTKKMANHSIPALQGIVQTQMLEDSAETLDTLYLDATARSGRPAGMQDTTETGAANINASTGNTSAQILSDTKDMIGRLLAARAGESAVWVMNPLRVLGLRDVQDAASGEFTFRSEMASGTFRGYPFISSQNVTANVVVLQSSQAVTFANDYSPMIDVSDETTLVFDDTAPQDIGPGASLTQPAKSMYQIHGIAVKMTLGLDWRIVRQGGVQVLTGVSW